MGRWRSRGRGGKELATLPGGSPLQLGLGGRQPGRRCGAVDADGRAERGAYALHAGAQSQLVPTRTRVMATLNVPVRPQRRIWARAAVPSRTHRQPQGPRVDGGFVGVSHGLVHSIGSGCILAGWRTSRGHNAAEEEVANKSVNQLIANVMWSRCTQATFGFEVIPRPAQIHPTADPSRRRGRGDALPNRHPYGF